ncbi:lyase family protein, partial [Xanthobacter tagetidis]
MSKVRVGIIFGGRSAEHEVSLQSARNIVDALDRSRLAEDVVSGTSPSFALVKLADACPPGSSIMPKKRTPDAAALVRAPAGRCGGALTALLVVMKGRSEE